MVESNVKFVLKEQYVPFGTEKDLLRSGNMYCWDEDVISSIG